MSPVFRTLRPMLRASSSLPWRSRLTPIKAFKMLLPGYFSTAAFASLKALGKLRESIASYTRAALRSCADAIAASDEWPRRSARADGGAYAINLLITPGGSTFCAHFSFPRPNETRDSSCSHGGRLGLFGMRGALRPGGEVSYAPQRRVLPLPLLPVQRMRTAHQRHVRDHGFGRCDRILASFVPPSIAHAGVRRMRRAAEAGCKRGGEVLLEPVLAAEMVRPPQTDRLFSVQSGCGTSERLRHAQRRWARNVRAAALRRLL